MTTNIEPFSRHELLDRTNIVVSQVNDLLFAHKDFKLLPESTRKLINDAIYNLAQAYQEIGELELNDDN